MILIGTIVGKVYVFNYDQQSIESKMLEAQRDNGIKFLRFDDKDEQYAILATKKGTIAKTNIYDAFDSREIESNISNVSTADYLFDSDTIFFGTENGHIYNHKFSNSEDPM